MFVNTERSHWFAFFSKQCLHLLNLKPVVTNPQNFHLVQTHTAYSYHTADLAITSHKPFLLSFLLPVAKNGRVKTVG